MAHLDVESLAELHRAAQNAPGPSEQHCAAYAACWGKNAGATTFIGGRALPHLRAVGQTGIEAKVYVRDDYVRCFELVLERREKAGQASWGVEGIIVSGQEGLGKTRFLDYALFRLLETRTPVVLVSTGAPWTATLFLDAGCFCIPSDRLCCLDVLVSPVILCSTTAELARVPHHFYSSVAQAAFVLSTPDVPDVYGRCGDDLGALYWVLEPVPPQEFVDILLLRKYGSTASSSFAPLASLAASSFTLASFPSLYQICRSLLEERGCQHDFSHLPSVSKIGANNLLTLSGIELLDPVDPASPFYHPLELFLLNGPSLTRNLRSNVARTTDPVADLLGSCTAAHVLAPAPTERWQPALTRPRCCFDRFFFLFRDEQFEQGDGGFLRTELDVASPFLRQVLVDAFLAWPQERQDAFLVRLRAEERWHGSRVLAVFDTAAREDRIAPPILVSRTSLSSGLFRLSAFLVTHFLNLPTSLRAICQSFHL